MWTSGGAGNLQIGVNEFEIRHRPERMRAKHRKRFAKRGRACELRGYGPSSALNVDESEKIFAQSQAHSPTGLSSLPARQASIFRRLRKISVLLSVVIDVAGPVKFQLGSFKARRIAAGSPIRPNPGRLMSRWNFSRKSASGKSSHKKDSPAPTWSRSRTVKC